MSAALADRYRMTSPVLMGTFVIGQLTVQFIRNRGQVMGFELSHPRARRLAFTRSPTTDKRP